MKLTIKQSFVAMAICTSLYTLFLTLWQVPTINSLQSNVPNLFYLSHLAMLIGMMILGVGLYYNNHQIPQLSKSLQWQAIVIVATTLCMTIYNCLFHGAVMINGIAYFYWQNPWLHIAITALVAVWLWQYAYSKTDGVIRNTGIGIVGLLMAFFATLLLVFMLVSFVRVLAMGEVAGFRVTTWLSWLRPVALLAFPVAYLCGFKNKQKDNEAVPVVYSRANRVIAKLSVMMVVMWGIIAILGVGFDWFEDFAFEDAFYVFMLSAVHLLWIASVIAMLLERNAKKWLRVLNTIAPLAINVIVVLVLCISAAIPREVRLEMSAFLKDDLPIILVSCSAIYCVLVWIINTVVVLRARTDFKNISDI